MEILSYNFLQFSLDKIIKRYENDKIDKSEFICDIIDLFLLILGKLDERTKINLN